MGDKHYRVTQIDTEGDEGSSEYWRDVNAFFRERRENNKATAIEFLPILTKIVGPIERQQDDTVWVMTFNGKRLQYWPARGKWYQPGMEGSLTGGIQSFVGWLKKHASTAKGQTEPTTTLIQQRGDANSGFKQVRIVGPNCAITTGKDYPGTTEDNFDG